MPKVGPEYFEKKRKMIVEATYNVCLRKPVEMVTISDVIAETGMSQGAIYRYYDGLDAILADMLTDLRVEYSVVDRLKEITSDNESPFEELTYKVCDVLADAMERHLSDVQKINFDMGVIAINEPQRAAKIMSGIKGVGNLEYLKSAAIPHLVMQAAKQGHRPLGDEAELAPYIASVYTGIEKYCIMAACYGTGYPNTSADPRALFHTFAKTIILLFGGSVS